MSRRLSSRSDRRRCLTTAPVDVHHYCRCLRHVVWSSSSLSLWSCIVVVSIYIFVSSPSGRLSSLSIYGCRSSLFMIGDLRLCLYRFSATHDRWLSSVLCPSLFWSMPTVSSSCCLPTISWLLSDHHSVVDSVTVTVTVTVSVSFYPFESASLSLSGGSCMSLSRPFGRLCLTCLCIQPLLYSTIPAASAIILALSPSPAVAISDRCCLAVSVFRRPPTPSVFLAACLLPRPCLVLRPLRPLQPLSGYSDWFPALPAAFSAVWPVVSLSFGVSSAVRPRVCSWLLGSLALSVSVRLYLRQKPFSSLVVFVWRPEPFVRQCCCRVTLVGPAVFACVCLL